MKRKGINLAVTVMAMATIATLGAGCGSNNESQNVEAIATDAATDIGKDDEAIGEADENSGKDNSEAATDSEKSEATANSESGEKTKQAPTPRDKVTSFTPQDDLDLTQDIFVQKINNLPEDFILGMDASSVLVLENSGVRYYDFEGKEADVFKTLSEAGVNYIRLRVWNDPYDENGYGYGGGNNDVETAVILGKRATEYGMKVSIDFHYSDFWADPKRQHCPKAWEGMSMSEKKEALYEYTKESLSELLDAGVDVSMVQIGNEINYGMAGESSQANVTALLAEGSKAVREISTQYDRDIRIVVHYTNIEDMDQVKNRVTNLSLANVDYDMIGLSFYPFWDGNFENMQNVVKMIQDVTGKEVFLAETSYCYTSVDGDGSGNSVSGTDDIVEGYPASVQGQANILRDTMAAVNEAGGKGIFYWEGVWLPVGAATDNNSEIWETYGSGWASSYAGDYDPEDAGLYYGGCSWENQALFNFEGKPLQSLNTFKYIRTGHETELKIETVPDVYMTLTTGDSIKLPEKANVIYNDTSKNTTVPVIWDSETLSKIDNSMPGKYDITGKIDDNTTTTCHLEIKLPNQIVNGSFEDEDTSMWTITCEKSSNPTDYQVKADDAHTGEVALHYWAGDGDTEFRVSQKVEDLSGGKYTLQCFAQGGDTSDDSVLELYITVNGLTTTKTFMVTNWAEWKNPVISGIKIEKGDNVEIGVHYKTNKGSWGTVDDFTLEKE